MLRPRPEYGYATPSHWHGHSRIELDSSADFASPLVSRISPASMAMFRPPASETGNEHEAPDGDSTGESPTGPYRERHEYGQ
jgi:hypothetical protein